jgi:hypothetical protein
MKEAILALRAKGYSYNQIQEELGCSKGTIAYYCGAGQKEKNLQRNRDRRSKIRKFLQESKQVPCADCKEDYPYWIMQFDHVRGDKKFNLSMFGSQASGIDMDVIKEEILKCDVVCANCHANRTHLRLVKSGSDVVDLTQQYG